MTDEDVGYGGRGHGTSEEPAESTISSPGCSSTKEFGSFYNYTLSFFPDRNRSSTPSGLGRNPGIVARIRRHERDMRKAIQVPAPRWYAHLQAAGFIT